MELSDFDYTLPEELIAQKAAMPKDSSRLMVCYGDKIVHEKSFRDIVKYFSSGDVIVVNDTKVARAKIQGKKASGTKCEVVLTEKVDDFTFRCMVTGKRVRVGTEYIFDGFKGQITADDDCGFTIKFDRKITDDIKEKYFELPLPPYVKRKVSEDSEYQTVYSDKEGSVAAPTAGLHFTERVMEELADKGVIIVGLCLHVGYGTFLPVRGKITEHRMHSEWYCVSEEVAEAINDRNGKLFVVGTTTMRTLESCSENGKVKAGCGNTSIFICPGYKFKLRYDGMITNFHFPRSTLLMLVSAYFGREKILNAYKEAVRQKYRFYSLGDACLLLNSQPQ